MPKTGAFFLPCAKRQGATGSKAEPLVGGVPISDNNLGVGAGGLSTLLASDVPNLGPVPNFT